MLDSNLGVLSSEIGGVSGACRIFNGIPPDFVRSNCLVLLSKALTSVLLAVAPNLAVVGDVLTVTGTNFIADPALVNVFVNDVQVPTLSVWLFDYCDEFD